MRLGKSRRAASAVAVLAALALLLVPALSTGGTALAQGNEQRTITIQVFVCPPGMTGQTLAPEECDPLDSGVDVEITSLNGTEGPFTVADAQATGNSLLWTASSSGNETDEWGIRQTELPPNTRAYVVQGAGVTLDQADTHDYTFSTSASSPDASLNLYVLLQEDAPVITPPGEGEEETTEPADTSDTTETADTETEEDTTDEDTTTAAAPTDPEFAAGASVVVVDGPVNLRESAGVDAAVVTELETGTALTVVSGGVQAGDFIWYEVGVTGAETTGWVAADYLERAPEDTDDTAAEDTTTTETTTEPTTTAASTESDTVSAAATFPAGSRVIVFDGPLNLRASAGTGGAVVEVLPQNAVLTVLSGPTSANGYNWYQVETDLGVTGYVADAFIEAHGFVVGDVVFVNTDALNVRSAPGTGSTVLDVIFTNTVATVTGGPQSANGYTWYEIDVPGVVAGWVVGQYLALSDAPPVPPSGEFGAGSWIFVFDPPVNFRTSAGTGGTVIRALPDGEGVLVLSGPTSANGYSWYQVEDEGEVGYVAGEFFTGGFYLGANAMVADGPLNLRSAPGTSSSILVTLTQDEVISVLNVNPTIINGQYWFQVTTSGAVTGWVAGRYLGPA